MKEIAHWKFKRMLTAKFASCERTRLSYDEILNLSNKEQIRNEDLMFELMKYWCDLFEHRQDTHIAITNKEIINRLAAICIKIENYSLALTCFIIEYIIIIENNKSPNIELSIVFKNIALCYCPWLYQNNEKARKYLSMALIIDDPKADIEIKLRNKLEICEIQQNNFGVNSESVEILNKIHREAETRGLKSIALYANALLFKALGDLGNFESVSESLERIRELIAQPEVRSFLTDEELSDFEQLESNRVSSIFRQMSPTYTECSSERKIQQFDASSNSLEASKQSR